MASTADEFNAPELNLFSSVNNGAAVCAGPHLAIDDFPGLVFVPMRRNLIVFR